MGFHKIVKLTCLSSFLEAILSTVRVSVSTLSISLLIIGCHFSR